MRSFARHVSRIAAVMVGLDVPEVVLPHDSAFLASIARACQDWRHVEDERLRSEAAKTPAEGKQ